MTVVHEFGDVVVGGPQCALHGPCVIALPVREEALGPKRLAPTRLRATRSSASLGSGNTSRRYTRSPCESNATCTIAANVVSSRL